MSAKVPTKPSPKPVCPHPAAAVPTRVPGMKR